MAKSSYHTSEVRGSGQRQRPRVPDCDGAGTAERSYHASEVWGGGGSDERSYTTSEARAGDREEQPTPKARGGGQEVQPHIQGAVGAPVQEGLEELSHVEGQEGQW